MVSATVQLLAITIIIMGISITQQYECVPPVALTPFSQYLLVLFAAFWGGGGHYAADLHGFLYCPA